MSLRCEHEYRVSIELANHFIGRMQRGGRKINATVLPVWDLRHREVVVLSVRDAIGVGTMWQTKTMWQSEPQSG
jgi:hypothetical protein